MKKTLVCGSYAFDSIMVFQDKFKNHILPDKLHILNVCFYTPSMRKEFGGCAGNISYNLNLLDDRVCPIATVGNDFAPYRDRIKKLNISDKYIKTMPKHYTAQAFITTDIDDNQITAFHPGAMDEAHLNSITKLNIDAAIAIIAPDGKRAMIEHARELFELNIPFIFDPGQGLPMFNKDELLIFISQASWITLNDYELEVLKENSGLSTKEIAKQVQALIITKGASGCDIYLQNEVLEVKGVKAKAVDPTGCGDAYRAGIIFGIKNNLDWHSTAKLANLIGAIKVEVSGPQNHSFNLNSIQKLYHQKYNTKLL